MVQLTAMSWSPCCILITLCKLLVYERIDREEERKIRRESRRGRW